ncbi:MAG: insulinase family protein [bacterium]|nr:insulinase family protein [bacterium]
MLINCKIEKFVERERQVIINEYMERFPTQLSVDIATKINKVFFGDTRLGTFLRPLGKAETILAITLDDIREFYDRCYVPANISIVAIGGIELGQFVDALEASPFGLERPGHRIQLPKPMAEIKNPSENKWDLSAAEIAKIAFHQSSIDVVAVIPGIINPKALEVAEDTLRKTFFCEIREKRGWNYGSDISLEWLLEAYKFSFRTKFQWENLNAMEGLIDECVRIASRDSDEIQRFIRTRVNGYKIIDPDARKVVDVVGYDLAERGHIITYADDISSAKSVTVEEVRMVLSQLSRDRRFTMTLRP